MWSLVFRLALMGSTLIVAWNVTRGWLAVLRAPKKVAALPKQSRAEISARVMAEEATRHLTAIEVAIAALADEELWTATEALCAAVRRLEAAMLADPEHYRRAKRHLSQILIATEQTAKHFARHYAATHNPGTRRKHLDLTAELTDAYNRAADSYAETGAEALEIEAKTLKELLRRNRL